MLVLPCPEQGCRFGGTPFVDFAESLPCPVILVGPGHPGKLRLNSPACPLASTILPVDASWTELESAVTVPGGVL